LTRLAFTKMSGAGNDFVVVDAARLPRGLGGSELARRLCPRRTSVGADGVLLLGRKGLVCRYFNADGSAAFCGNGSRCAALWMALRGWAGPAFAMDSGSGPIEARVAGGRASVRLPDAEVLAPSLVLRALGRRFQAALVRVGVPHLVTRVRPAALAGLPVREWGRALRIHPALGPGGANVDFLALSSRGASLRTYERGVEDETLACGTGAAAAAVCAALWAGRRSPVVLAAAGGRLRASFRPAARAKPGRFTDVWLQGPAEEVFSGEVIL
jgi:diaminopimelate epimerase